MSSGNFVDGGYTEHAPVALLGLYYIISFYSLEEISYFLNIIFEILSARWKKKFVAGNVLRCFP